jgi:hypothetical protein
VRTAIDWYRDHGRLHCGDTIAMATDALAAYRHDVAVGKDALLLGDTLEMADALNHRIHGDTIDADTPTVTGARGHRIANGDLILTRRNDLTIDVRQNPDSKLAAPDPVRNGNRWRVIGINHDTGRIAAKRLTDGALAAFDPDYIRAHIVHGYATTVHAAQGTTADATHAVLSENTTRALLYVALTRGRDANTAYLYEHTTEAEYGPTPPDGTHVLQRGTTHQAALLARTIITSHDDVPTTAQVAAASTPRNLLPDMVAGLLARRAEAVDRRRSDYQGWRQAADDTAASMTRAHANAASRSRNRSRDNGIEL